MSLPKQKATATAASNYATIRAEIESDRLHPWSSASSFSIGGIEVLPLTFRAYVDLTLAGNSLITGGDITAGDMAAYIWRSHEEFGDEDARKSFTKQLGAMTNHDELLNDCIDHYTSAFDDTPNAAGFGGTHINSALPPIPTIAIFCDEYGSAYGIDPREVADIDLRIVFQCCRAQRVKSGSKFLEPKRLREAKSEFLKSNG